MMGLWVIAAATLVVVLAIIGISARRGPAKTSAPNDLSVLPPRFVVFDLETTGLDSTRHHVIEIGAIRVETDRDQHATFATFVSPRGRISKRITALTGITREMLLAEGCDIGDALTSFADFVGDLPMVAFNAPFDLRFLHAECDRLQMPRFTNEISCALLAARRAWPDRSSHKLVDLARDGGLDVSSAHRALHDCRNTLTVFCSAIAINRTLESSSARRGEGRGHVPSAKPVTRVTGKVAPR